MYIMHKGVSTVKSKPKALQHFKVDPVLKIHEAVYNLCELNKCGNPITDLRLKKRHSGSMPENSGMVR